MCTNTTLPARDGRKRCTACSQSKGATGTSKCIARSSTVIEVGTGTVEGQRRVTARLLLPTHVHPHTASAVCSAGQCYTCLAWSLTVDRSCHVEPGTVPLAASCSVLQYRCEGWSTPETSTQQGHSPDSPGEEKHAAFLCPEWKGKEKPSVSQKPRGQKIVNFHSSIALGTWVAPSLK